MSKEDNPNSILDTDLYKLTMHYAVWKTYPDVKVSYGFINRSSSTQPFSLELFENLKDKIKTLETRVLKKEEKEWLSKNCQFLTSEYLDYLESFRFEPSKDLKLSFKVTDPIKNLGDIEISIEGLWIQTILYEVPLLSMISESYFETIDKDWSYDLQKERAIEKSNRLLRSGCKLLEFGTRRRRSFKAQAIVIEGLIESRRILGLVDDMIFTSNVLMAYRFGIKPVGTVAHEYIMAEGALNSYKGSNIRAMKTWEACFPNHPGLHRALCDTFTTKAFFEELINEPELAKRWIGFRQDSGDPKRFVLNTIETYKKLGIDPKTKSIVFSDGLNVDKCLELQEFCEEKGISTIYGIGTHLTNDFEKLSTGEKSKALNIVIKIFKVNGLNCVKISDDLSKATGDKETVENVKKVFNL